MTNKPLPKALKSAPLHLKDYTLRIDVVSFDGQHGLRGVIEQPASEATIAFNGLFELWHAIHHINAPPDPDVKQGLG